MASQEDYARIARKSYFPCRKSKRRCDKKFPSDDTIRNIATTFFQSIHMWMPIVSKRIFFTHLLNPLARRHNELSLLADGSSYVKSIIYQTAKTYYFKVEAAGVLSIHVLQAAVLIAVYEVGHAIYPAAYLSIGACARYGCMLGIDKLGLDLMGESLGPLTWIEVEERRRLWWAVLLLDRFMNLSDPRRHLVTEDPTFDTYLPVDDTAWDDCTTKPGDTVIISNGLTLKMGIFSRVAQATYLLSEALKSVPPRVNY
ncbi:hypothetical protein LARI1_G005900 [Lachnellula arida]|uniref:Xylanolytic transcriptional activator regulatory domain-containing protein n=1 Tax=Lachnellula arida TaxID=1316785 RepID=A0A8T9B862_9HELO|nr:hypothetical protein LARI1_G005900 [Lachnellula arida]